MGGCGSSKRKRELSAKLNERLSSIFRQIDVDDSKTIDREETLKFWFASMLLHSPTYRKSNFAKINTKALFDAVDIDKNGAIEYQEWMAFWQTVKDAGYKETEIITEVSHHKIQFT